MTETRQTLLAACLTLATADGKPEELMVINEPPPLPARKQDHMLTPISHPETNKTSPNYHCRLNPRRLKLFFHTYNLIDQLQTFFSFTNAVPINKIISRVILILTAHGILGKCNRINRESYGYIHTR